MPRNNFDQILGQPQNVANPTHNDIDRAKEQINNDTYTVEERNDVNEIFVSIPDPDSPIVVLFGAPASGKTLAMLRMIRFLEAHNFQTEPEVLFRPESDKHFKKMCNELKNMAYSQYAPGPTDIVNFMLLKVLDNGGHTLCQILEAPGEHYFDGTASLEFPTYIENVVAAPNRKVWVFFVEQDWNGNRALYAQKICSMQSKISPNDKVVFLFNQADKKVKQFKRNGRPNTEVFFSNIKNQYPGIFSKYANSGFEKLLFGEYNFKAVCFSSGTFTKSGENEIWIPGKDWFCEELWKAIR